MGTIKKARYNVDNGTDFDTMHYETEESVIVGANQNINDIGFRVFPPGNDGKRFKIMYGFKDIDITKSSATGRAKVYTPIAFETGAYKVIASVSLVEDKKNFYNDTFIVATSHGASADFDISVKQLPNTDFVPNRVTVEWIAMGY